ncbi:MAG: response regulator [Deltaproteobacteria bacterium]|nr:response regulator [Deltaproteobacteria bacterium]MBN2672452.1 response regulator [Deltaproteobacteria bacterium]
MNLKQDPYTKTRLDDIATSYAPLFALTIALVLSTYTVFNLLGFTTDFNRMMLIHDSGISLSAFAVSFITWRRLIPAKYTHAVISILTLNIAVTLLHSMLLSPQPIYTILFMMYFLTIGTLYLSRLWALTVIASAGTGWFIVGSNVYSEHQFVDYSLAVSAVILTSLMILQNRIAIHSKMIGLHKEDEETKESLAQSLAKTKEQIDERKKAESEQSRLEQQLRQAQKMEAVGRLAGGMAHDINNMLAAISGTAEALLQEIATNENVRLDLHNILQACSRGKMLTSNLLGFAQKGKYRRERIDVNQTIRDVHTFMSRSIPGGVLFETILCEDLRHIEGDPGQINQVLVNLINNAVDAMSGEGHLVITTENVSDVERQGVVGLEHVTGNYIKVIVSDTGHGMKDGTLERAFEPFFSTKKMGEGTGLGLSMVYGTITNHGGAVLIRSALNQGTAVTIYLPEYTRQSLQTTKDSGEYLMSDDGNCTILLVDDEPLVRRSGTRILTQMGHRVIEAENGEEAIQKYADTTPPVDVVLLDLIMPGMDGDEVFDALQKMDPNVRVIFVSAFSKDTIRVDNLLADGALDFIQKPFSVKQIAQSIDMARAHPK